MREIKFRGRSSKDNKTWFTGSLVSLTDIDEAYIDHYDGLRRVIERYPVNTATVGQFTGLKDADGREIYEGDIVKFTKPAYTNIPVVITWEDGAFMVDYDLYLGGRDLSSVTVIGNVHDNPELLEAQNARD